MFQFIIESIAFGVGLAMDAFSVSLANGLGDMNMKKRKAFLIAGTFAFFQALMPMLGWICIHTIVEKFNAFQKFIPWIALVLLCFIGGKMIYEAISKKEAESTGSLAIGALIVQGIATSIDALSVGFTIAEYAFMKAFGEAMIIAVVTFGICVLGVYLGKKFGTRLAGKANIFGGIILILIGIEIFLTGIL